MFGDIKPFKIRQQEIDSGEHYFHNDIDVALMYMFSFYGDKTKPIAELGVFEGKTSMFLYQSALEQNRQLFLVDNFEFLSEKNISKFTDEVLYNRLKKVNSNLQDCTLINANCEDLDYTDIDASFIYFDAWDHRRSMDSILDICGDDSILVFSTPTFNHSLALINKISENFLKGRMYPIASSSRRLFCAKSLEFANLVKNDLTTNKIWNYLEKQVDIVKEYYDYPEFTYRIKYEPYWKGVRSAMDDYDDALTFNRPIVVYK